MKIFGILGKSGSGKTLAALGCTRIAIEHGLMVGGIASPGKFVNNVRFSFNIMDLSDNRQMFLCSREFVSPVICGPFGFDKNGLEFGCSAIRKAVQNRVDILIVDEVGPLELHGMGWASPFQEAVESDIGNLLITIRPGIVSDIKAKFLHNQDIYTFSVEDYKNGMKCIFPN